MRRSFVAIALVVGLLATALPVKAHEAPVATFHATYETSSGAGAGAQADDVIGVTADGRYNAGAVFVRPRRGEHIHAAQFGISDDVWGYGRVGGWICTDENDNEVFCEDAAGEVRRGFCGQSPKVDLGTLHQDDTLAMFLMDARGQTFNCDPAAAAHPTSGGVLNPDGGIFGLTEGGAIRFVDTPGVMAACQEASCDPCDGVDCNPCDDVVGDPDCVPDCGDEVDCNPCDDLVDDPDCVPDDCGATSDCPTVRDLYGRVDRLSCDGHWGTPDTGQGDEGSIVGSRVPEEGKEEWRTAHDRARDGLQTASKARRDVQREASPYSDNVDPATAAGLAISVLSFAWRVYQALDHEPWVPEDRWYVTCEADLTFSGTCSGDLLEEPRECVIQVDEAHAPGADSESPEASEVWADVEECAYNDLSGKPECTVTWSTSVGPAVPPGQEGELWKDRPPISLGETCIDPVTWLRVLDRAKHDPEGVWTTAEKTVTNDGTPSERFDDPAYFADNCVHVGEIDWPRQEWGYCARHTYAGFCEDVRKRCFDPNREQEPIWECGDPDDHLGDLLDYLD